MADTETEKPQSYIIKMLFHTSPLMAKYQERDINMGLKVGAKPSEIASGLEALAASIRQNLPDQPASLALVNPSAKKAH